MKIFWSWQSDTDADTGRYFVRDCLVDAIKQLRQPEEIDERPDREFWPGLELDQDRKGVSGHPGLADTIFGKIDAAAVFVADVTLVAELIIKLSEDNPDGIKKLINSNVAIEYGYAVKSLDDAAILLVMNLHYGPLVKLPFDLSHKLAPCRYRLAPDAPREEIRRVRKGLTSDLVNALRLHVSRLAMQKPESTFERVATTTNAASFWTRGEILASRRIPKFFAAAGDGDDADLTPYQFEEHHAFYLRVIPTIAIPKLARTKLKEIADSNQVLVLSRMGRSTLTDRNAYGAICVEEHNNSTSPTAFTQLHTNGEIWGVSKEFISTFQDFTAVVATNFELALKNVLPNFVEVTRQLLGTSPPYEIEIGAVGLSHTKLIVWRGPNERHNRFSDWVHVPAIEFKDILLLADKVDQERVIAKFIRELYDLAGESV